MFQSISTFLENLFFPDEYADQSYLEETADKQAFAGSEKNILLGKWMKNPDDLKLNSQLKKIIANNLLIEGFNIKRADFSTLEVTGTQHKRIKAYYCKYKNMAYLLLLPAEPLSAENAAGFIEKTRTCKIHLPDFFPPSWENYFTGQIINSDNTLLAKNLFHKIPVAFYRGINHQPNRSAGILLHITSLAGSAGCGDIGNEAYDFVDFLHRNKQQYWQILPVNATDRLSGYSPYSGLSAFAGNELFIDIRQLVNEGLLKPGQYKKITTGHQPKSDFETVESNKKKLLDKAFIKFKKEKDTLLSSAFTEFCHNEKYWLNDFAIFSTLRKYFKYKHWTDWPPEYRDRQVKTINSFASEYFYEIEKTKFKQFIFDRQWQKLKSYANDKGVHIFGDAPIYISYNSADVWAQPGLFRLAADKSMEVVAGVPPDYFNADGQFWNMPIYRWDKMKENGFEWWVKRLKKNMEWFDLIRLDHFRGFAAYWQIPGKDKTAINGKWVKGPGNDLFDTLITAIPGLKIVAEDLGDIDREVNELRDLYRLPGMKVLQFAFGKHLQFSEHIPHNHLYNNIVYTGTHDNNTTKGWFNKEVKESNLNRIKNYTGIKITKNNCCKEFIRLAYASGAKTAIIPMQDLLELGEKSRMNKPSTTSGNWLWKMVPGQIKPRHEKLLQKYVKMYGRY
jgi:4-alpha-glucanotransferase